MTLVLDNGSGLFKAGWATDTYPSLVVEPVVTKIRDKTMTAPRLYVGSAAGGRIERQRTPFDDGVLIASDLMEAVLDHAFINMNINQNGFDRIVATETLAHPDLAQNILHELLFETYSAPAISVGIGSLFALHHISPTSLSPSDHASVVVSVGHSNTTVIPVTSSGYPLLDESKRLSCGWRKMSTYMQHITQLKYPEFPHILTAHDYQELMRKHCYVAQSYQTEALKLLYDSNLDVVVQYSVTQAHQTQVTQERVTLSPEEQERLSTDRTQFIADTVIARAKLDEKVNRQKASNAARKRSETKNRMRVMAALIDEEEDIGRGSRGRKGRIRQGMRFGDDQADWQVYSDLSKDTPEDVDDESVTALARLDRILAEYDPQRLHRVPYADQNNVLYRLASGPPLPRDSPDSERLQRAHQLRLNTECVRVPEILFNPSLVGVDEAGLHDLVLHAIQSIRAQCDPKTPTNSIRVVCTGGGATLSGLTDRLSLELTRDLPADMRLEVIASPDPVYDAWRGATHAPVTWTTREQWYEMGSLNRSVFSNPS